MHYVNPTAFENESGMRKVQVFFDDDDKPTSLEVSSTNTGTSIFMALREDDREALISLLQGKKLTPPLPQFKVGDIVRLTGGTTMGATVGALARVVKGNHHVPILKDEVIGVEWISDLANAQRDGEYYASDFVIVAPADLTDEDYVAIGRRAAHRRTV